MARGAPILARRSRALVVRPQAKGQKGMRKVLTNPMEQYAPGSVLGKMFNVRLNKINWAVLSDAADKLEGELASQPILAGRPLGNSGHSPCMRSSRPPR